MELKTEPASFEFVFNAAAKPKPYLISPDKRMCPCKNSRRAQAQKHSYLWTRIAASLSLRATADEHVDVRVNCPSCLFNTSHTKHKNKNCTSRKVGSIIEWRLCRQKELKGSIKKLQSRMTAGFCPSTFTERWKMIEYNFFSLSL
jgi:hypothetical protein